MHRLSQASYSSQKTEDLIQEEYEQSFKYKLQSLELIDQDVFSEKNLEKIINDAINSLPERCREIFIKSRIEKKKTKRDCGGNEPVHQYNRKSNGYRL